MLSLLQTRRWLSFTAAALVAIVAFGLLSLWQYHRAEDKRLEYAAVAGRLSAEPTVPGYTDSGAGLDWRHVQLRGRYDPQAQFLIRNRPLGGSNGFWVASLLVTNEGSTWVVRGWMPAQGAASAAAAAPAPPEGDQVVDGYARMPDPDPARAAADIPPGQATAVNPADLSQLVGRASPATWYVIAAADSQLARIPPPEPTDSRNLSYAGQWLLFAAITVGGWFYFLRREAAELDAESSAPPVAAA